MCTIIVAPHWWTVDGQYQDGPRPSREALLSWGFQYQGGTGVGLEDRWVRTGPQWGAGTSLGVVEVCDSEAQARAVVELQAAGVDTVYRHVADVRCTTGWVAALWCAEELHADVAGYVAWWLEDLGREPTAAELDEAAHTFACDVLDSEATANRTVNA